MVALLAAGRVLRTFQLNLETLSGNRKAVHGLNGGMSRPRIVVRYESKAFGELSLLIDEHLGRQDNAERSKGGHKVGIGELLR